MASNKDGQAAVHHKLQVGGIDRRHSVLAKMQTIEENDYEQQQQQKVKSKRRLTVTKADIPESTYSLNFIPADDQDSTGKAAEAEERKQTGKGKSPRKSQVVKNPTNGFAEQFFEKYKIRLH